MVPAVKSSTRARIQVKLPVMFLAKFSVICVLAVSYSLTKNQSTSSVGSVSSGFDLDATLESIEIVSDGLQATKSTVVVGCLLAITVEIQA